MGIIKEELPKYTCCICGNKITGWGNNPWPINDDENARCCDTCNDLVVIPARISMMYDSKR